MQYLYGDGSEFPLNENFLQTLSAATDACVALLEVDAAHGRVRRALEAENANAISELAELGALRGAIERALTRNDDHRSSVHRVATELRELAFAHVEQARAEIKHHREEIQRRAAHAQDSARLIDALERFLASHQLPNTNWALSWWAGAGQQPAEARAYALMPRGMAATMAVRIPPTHLWARPVKVATLDKNLVIRMERKSWLGGVRMRDERLDRYYVTRVVHTPMREALVLSRSNHGRSGGICITFREQRDEQVRVVRVDAQENPISAPAVLVGSDKVMVQGLWVHVRRTIRDLIWYRRTIEMATLNGRSVLDLDRPIPLVRAIISAIAPWLRNIRRRSHMRGALELKLRKSDGRQQDLFISYYELLRKYRHLSPQHRAMFDTYGLTTAPERGSASRVEHARSGTRRSSQALGRRLARPSAATRPDTGRALAAIREHRERLGIHVPADPATPPPSPAVAEHLPRVSAMRPTAPASAPPQSAPPAVPVQQLVQLPAPSTPPRPRRSSVRASQRSNRLPPTIPPPPLDAYAPRQLPPTIPPPPPEAYAVGAEPVHVPPPPARPRQETTMPTRPALRLINGSG